MVALTHWVCFLFFLRELLMLCPRLSIVFQRLVRLGSFPACCRQANVIPIPKGPPSSSVANYRPISITSVLSKVFECLVSVLPSDWGCIVQDLETIIVLVLLAFNFIPQRSHYSLTLPRSRIRDSATATLTPGGWHNSHQSGVISITDQLIFQNGKKLRSVLEEQ